MAPPGNLHSYDNPPSNNLWIGNVAPDVSETELKSLFEKYGKIDTVTTYPSRNYAFVYFKEIEGAKAAKQALQGHVFRGNTLKIEFAKPAKPCKSLWVSGIGQSISKEELEKEFLRFGKIQEIRFLRDRNTAYVDYVSLEDAIQALKSMNGKRIGGAQLRVDYLRSQPSKREQGPDTNIGQLAARNTVPSDFHWMGRDSLNKYPEASLSGSKRNNQFLPMGLQHGDAPLSNVLLISYPPSVIIEEDMLHNAMILFGEIERIKTFSDRNYAFVEFRSVEEARRAKEGLEGKLFNDPRILIEYSNTEFPGMGGQAGEYPFQPVQMDILGLGRPALLGSNPGPPPSLGISGPDVHIRPPLGPQSTFEPTLHGPELIDLAAVRKLQNAGPQHLMGGSTWRRSSPTPAMGSLPSASLNVPNRSASGAWDVFDANQLQRESKRSRIDSALPSHRENLAGLGEQHGLHSLSRAGAPISLTRGTTGGLGQRHIESDCIWRGLIAKGGTPVCRARCVPIGEGLGVDIPDVVNCSARTGLDLLSKHYEDAIGFNIVFFLPDSEEDFASYTEFLRYLGSRDRAGVAKFDDGTTLFLVPPSDFLTKVLKVSGPERLYGVVLKFRQVAPSITEMNPQSIHPQYADPPKMTTSHVGYNAIPPDERALTLDNSRVVPEDSRLPSKVPVPVTSSFPANSIPPTIVASQAGLTLTPELIATLTSLLPTSSGASGSQTAQVLQTSSVLGVTSNVATGPGTIATPWKQEHQALDHNGQLHQQLGSEINSQLQHLQAAQATPMASNMSSHFNRALNSYSQMHDSTINFTPQSAATSKPMAPVIPLHNGPVSVAPEINQHYQQDSSHDVLRGQGIDNGTDALRFYNPSLGQQPPYPVALSNHMHGGGFSQPQPYMPSEVEHPHQSQQIQTTPPGLIQETAESEADKNERYKTTLLFAANLLSRIHQPAGNQPGQGAGTH
ncbi:RNA-binding protein ELAV/HU (RRM superfamily) [Handroanthus impetiginosus]|uniref:RNA-binding protein ELAV/HU (RRM superfamily) n=1 Tax=Handroanthus impetiginosus TaxID=429701 RepID=A0A2G9GFW9_9LAMI|nr:RNA-binding protein ELAV/HU (RRM superfamily) [Handroanthus impetiginosus]